MGFVQWFIQWVNSGPLFSRHGSQWVHPLLSVATHQVNPLSPLLQRNSRTTWEKKKLINIENVGGTRPHLGCDRPMDVSRLPRGNVQFVPQSQPPSPRFVPISPFSSDCSDLRSMFSGMPRFVPICSDFFRSVFRTNQGNPFLPTPFDVPDRDILPNLCGFTQRTGRDVPASLGRCLGISKPVVWGTRGLHP